MACRLIGAEPLLEQMPEYFNLNFRNHFQWNVSQNSNVFILDNSIKNVVCGTAAIL